MKQCISILIQTLNEENNLPKLLKTISWCDDIVVLDSLSTDETKSIALNHGCRWFERKYDGRGPHQTWAMENIEYKHNWVFYLDADEAMTPELREEIEQIANDPKESRVAYYCRRKNFLMEKWLKYSSPPGHIMRFFQPKHIRFERAANPVAIIDGEHGYLENYFLHYNFSKGFNEWIQRHNRYSDYEAKETIKAVRNYPVNFKNLFSKDRTKRILELKNLSFRLPARPLWKFLYFYGLRRGFLDGSAGLTYCILQSIYEYFIVLKVREINYIQEDREI